MEIIKTSIIFVHFSTGECKSYMARGCLANFRRLQVKDPSLELIVINNSPNERDSYFKDWCDVYFYNPGNNFAYARNWGFDHSQGEYVCFADDDIYPDRMFWEECVKLLEKYPDRKLIATPIYTGCHLKGKYNQGYLDGHLLNLRSGSNCLLMSRKTFLDIGRFDETLSVHYVGVEFCNRYIKKGYMAIHTQPGLARNIGIRNFPYKYNL